VCLNSAQVRVIYLFLNEVSLHQFEDKTRKKLFLLLNCTNVHSICIYALLLYHVNKPLSILSSLLMFASLYKLRLMANINKVHVTLKKCKWIVPRLFNSLLNTLVYGSFILKVYEDVEEYLGDRKPLILNGLWNIVENGAFVQYEQLFHFAQWLQMLLASEVSRDTFYFKHVEVL